MGHLTRLACVIAIAALSLAFFTGAARGIEPDYLKRAGFQPMAEEAPDFTLKGASGERISMKDLKGKVVLLHFWATWCKPCKEEFPLFERLYNAMGNEFVFLPVSIDANMTGEKVNSFAIGLGATFPVYLAREGDVTAKYWTWGVPVTYVIDRKGIISGRALGPRDWASEEVFGLIKAFNEER